ncbi:unnamed protein product, partial [Laminaria digitata]
MEDDATRWGTSPIDGDIPSAAVKKVGANKSDNETGEPLLCEVCEASSTQPRPDNEQQERPSSCDAGYADVFGERSSGGPSAAIAKADSSDSERPVVAVSGHGWPVDDLESMFDAAEENALLPESLLVHLEAGEHAVDDTTAVADDTRNVSDRGSGHDIGLKDWSEGNLEMVSASSGDDDDNSSSSSASSTGVAAMVTPPPLPPTPRRTPATPNPAASAGEHDDWKDYSCATPWEYFVNDVGNAMRAFESREAVAARVARSKASAGGEGGGFEGRRKEL